MVLLTNRHREQNEPERWGYYQHLLNGAPSGAPHTCVLYSYEKVMDDVVTPNFHKRIAAGEIINNPCTFTSVRTHCGGGSYRADNGSSVYTSSGTGSLTYRTLHLSGSGLIDTIPPSVQSVSASDDVAKLRAFAFIDKTPYAFAEDVFELRETLRFLRNPVTSLNGLAKSFSQQRGLSKVGKATSITKSLGDVWLQYRFAASPLVRSIVDAVEYHYAQKKTFPKRLAARGKHFLKSEGVDHPLSVGNTYIRKGTLTSDVRAVILYEMTNPIRDYRFDLGVRAKDLPETIWAVMPYSFMVDRVFNVSQYIRGLTNALDPTVKILSGSVTRREQRVSTLAYEWQDAPTYTLEIEGDDLITETFSYERQPWIPTMVDAAPAFTPQALVQDLTSIADLLTLALARFR